MGGSGETIPVPQGNDGILYDLIQFVGGDEARPRWQQDIVYHISGGLAAMLAIPRGNDGISYSSVNHLVATLSPGDRYSPPVWMCKDEVENKIQCLK